MAVRTDIGVMPQPLRWLAEHPSLSWAALAAAALWYRRRRGRLGLSPVSSDWLLEHERRSIRRHEP